jgi:hypothetical protein
MEQHVIRLCLALAYEASVPMDVEDKGIALSTGAAFSRMALKTAQTEFIVGLFRLTGNTAARSARFCPCLLFY